MSTKIKIKRVQTRYITTDEDIYDALSLITRSVYQALRFEADYSKECSTVTMTLPEIAIKAKVSRRSVATSIKELETIHFLIKRTNWDNFKYGKTNDYEVARTLNHFKQNDEELYSSATDACVYNPEPPVHHVHYPSAPGALPPCTTCTPTYIDPLITTTTTTEVVVVVSDSVTKTLRDLYQETPIQSGNFKDENEFLGACKFSIENREKEYTQDQRLRAIKKFIKAGEFDKPKGFEKKESMVTFDRSHEYRAYVSQYKNDIKIGIKKLTPMLSEDEWLKS